MGESQCACRFGKLCSRHRRNPEDTPAHEPTATARTVSKRELAPGWVLFEEFGCPPLKPGFKQAVCTMPYCDAPALYGKRGETASKTLAACPGCADSMGAFSTARTVSVLVTPEAARLIERWRGMVSGSALPFDAAIDAFVELAALPNNLLRELAK